MSDTSKKSLESQTDWDAIANMTDDDIDLSDVPEITAEQMDRAVMRIGGKVVPRKKQRVNMYLDADIITYFKTKSGGRGYQTLINESLRSYIYEEGMEATIRKIVREELQLLV